jgi:probable HAF family extracellular repeat protein
MIHKVYLAAISFYVLSFSSLLGATFQRLGDFSGGNFGSMALGVSADGSVVVGSGTTAAGQQAFRWSLTTGMVSLGNLPDGSLRQTSALSVSADGSVIVGYGDPGSGWDNYKNFRWTQSTGMASLGSLNGATHNIAFGVSADGSVVVGDSVQQAFRWTQSGGITGLGFLSGQTNSSAVDVSADGSVVVGSSSNPGNEQAFRWTQSGGMVGLGYLSVGSYSFSNAVSPDGSVVVGTCGTSSGDLAFRWTQSTGMVSIGKLPGRITTHPSGVSSNGAVIVGSSYTDMTHGEAFIWDSAHGMRALKTVLQTDYGLNLTGWSLQAALDISPDGNNIVGYGTNPSSQTEAFRVSLVPEPATVVQLGLMAMLLGLAGIRRLRRRVLDCFQSPLLK